MGISINFSPKLAFKKNVSIYKYIKGTSTLQKLFYLIHLSMDTVLGYKEFREKKVKTLYSRMDDSMINKLREIRKKTGISVSEIIREGVRRLLIEVENSGSINLKIQ
jgi:Ribbon-helix-helix domain